MLIAEPQFANADLRNGNVGRLLMWGEDFGDNESCCNDELKSLKYYGC